MASLLVSTTAELYAKLFIPPAMPRYSSSDRALHVGLRESSTRMKIDFAKDEARSLGITHGRNACVRKSCPEVVSMWYPIRRQIRLQPARCISFGITIA